MKSNIKNGRKVLLATFGSLGDLHPSIALALELKARGHQPVIATSPVYEDKVKVFNLGFRPVRPDHPEAEVMVKAVEKGAEFLIREVLMPALPQSYEDTAAAAKDMEFLVSSPLAYAPRLVAEKSEIPWASLLLAPMGLFSAYDLPVMAELPSELRRIDLSLRKQVVSAVKSGIQAWAEPMHQLRANLGLPQLNDTLLDSNSPELVLALFSNTLASKQPDWPRQAVVAGFPFVDQDSAPAMDAKLEDFLNQGPAPIVFSLGSVSWHAAKNFYCESATAATRLGRRAVLVTAGVARDHLPSPAEGVLAVEYAPFAVLFPRAAAIVHHGGIGALGEAMRAGKPMLIVPFSNDQPDNAARAGRLGIARVIPRQHYEAARVERELRILLNYEQYWTNAKTVSRQVQSENGVATACDKLEQWFDSHVPARSKGNS